MARRKNKAMRNRNPAAAMPATDAVVLMAALHLLHTVDGQDCTFDTELDPGSEVSGLTPNYNAFDADSCKQACCDDPTCTTWQMVRSAHIGGCPCVGRAPWHMGHGSPPRLKVLPSTVLHRACVRPPRCCVCVLSARCSQVGGMHGMNTCA